MNLRDRRFEILRKVESGELSIEDGSRLLAALETGGELLASAGSTLPEEEPAPPVEAAPVEPFEAQPEVVPTSDEELERREENWKRWWVLPFGVGVVLTVISAYWMFTGYQAAGMGWGFWLSWFPFLLGLGIMVLAWYSQTLPWLHVRISNKSGDGHNQLALSLPLPLGLATWGIRRYEQFWPEKARDEHLGDIASALEETVGSSDAPMHITVDDDNEYVEVIITGARKANPA